MTHSGQRQNLQKGFLLLWPPSSLSALGLRTLSQFLPTYFQSRLNSTMALQLILCLAALASSAAAHPPPAYGHPIPFPPGPLPSPTGTGCTTTMIISQTRASTPPYWPECSFDGTERIYAATQTVTNRVDCHGCHNVEIDYEPLVHCPAMIITATSSESTPTTTYETLCSSTSTT